MEHGTRPYRPKRKDYDFLPSYKDHIIKKFGSLTPQFPEEFLTDATGWLPDQNTGGQLPASASSQPEGCTNYATVKAALILGVHDATVDKLEAITHANALGGFGVVESIDAARKSLKWFGWRFIIHSKQAGDWFNAFCLAQMSGLPEHRPIPWGTPWFKSWNEAILRGERILPMPTPAELQQAHTDPNSLPWHDHLLDGFSQKFDIKRGTLLYRDSSWQGSVIGYVYFTREVINVVHELSGTVAVVPTRSDLPPIIATISLPDWFWELLHSWMVGY